MHAIVTIGIPGSGKTYWARKQQGYEVVELDAARQIINGDASKQDNILEVVALRDKWILTAAADGKNLIVSDTNLDKDFRRILVDHLRGLGYTVELKLFDVDFEVCKQRNSSRERVVPEHAMERMQKSLKEQLELGHI